MARSDLTAMTALANSWKRDVKEAEVKIVANLVLRGLDKDFGGTLRSTFTTTAPDTSPTIDINQSSTSATVASGTFPTTYDGQLVQIEGSSTWYEISGTVANTGFTISSAFEGANITGATCEIAFHRVVLPSALIIMQDISRPGLKPLKHYVDELPVRGAENLETREPSGWYEVEALNTDDDMEIILVDPPDDVYTYVVTGRSRLARYTNSGSLCGLPERFENVLLTGVVWGLIGQTKGVGEASFWWSWHDKLLREARGARGPAYAGGASPMGGGDALRIRHPELVEDS